MEQIKKIIKQMLFLPPLHTLFIAVPAFALVIYVLTQHIDGLLAYISYTASAYALVIVLTGVSRIMRIFWQGVKAHPLGGRFVADAKFRTEISLYQGFVINLLYIVIKMVYGVYYKSLWFVSLAVYYALLAVMRLLLVYPIKAADSGTRRNREWCRYRLCGIVLLLMNQALAGIVIFIVHENRGYEYPGILIYAMAAYSFYAIMAAVVNVIKFRKRGSPVLSAAKAINLVAAMVSILSLETAMLAQFGRENSPDFRKFITGITGGCVCSFVLGMAIFMIAKSTKDIRPFNFKTFGRNKTIWK